jgi:hypothetical protein
VSLSFQFGFEFFSLPASRLAQIEAKRMVGTVKMSMDTMALV